MKRTRPIRIEFYLPAMRTFEQFVMIEKTPASYLHAAALRLPIATEAIHARTK